MEFLGLPRLVSVELYDATVETISNAATAGKFERERPNIHAEATRYALMALSGTLDSAVSTYKPKYVTVDELKSLYGRLRDRVGPRLLYNELIANASQNRCPYCSDREPETLDHYLSKADFSAFAVLAMNLVPCCYTCNSKKNAFELSAPGSQGASLHPYFDDVSTVRWLRARIVEYAGGPVARLFVDGAAISDPSLRAKAARHLAAFDLRTYFKIKSAQELSGLDETLPLLLRRSGKQAVLDELSTQSRQRAGGRSNSWEAALFDGLSESSWYLDSHLSRLAALTAATPDPRRPIPL